MQTDFRSHGLWERTAPPAPRTETLYSAVDTDIAIIGAGHTGLAAALRLAQAGYTPIVVDASHIGFGNSGRTIGLVTSGMRVKPEALPAALGPVFAQRLVTLLGDAPGKVFRLIDAQRIACDAVQSGTLLCASDARGAAAITTQMREWRRWGAPVELMGRAETASRVGSHAYSSAILDRRGGTLQPLAYARGLANAAMAAGARIFTNSPVTAFMQSGDHYVIDTERGQIRAARVVVATRTSSQGPFAAIAESLKVVPYFNLTTRPLPPAQRESILPDRQGVSDTRTLPSFFRIDAEGRLVFGSIGRLSGVGMTAHRGWAAREIARLFPRLAGIEFESEWHGLIGRTTTGFPNLYRLGPNVVAIAGNDGHGIAPATAFGHLLADMVTGHLPDEDLPLPVLNLPRPEPFRMIRGLAYSAGSCLLHLAGARALPF